MNSAFVFLQALSIRDFLRNAFRNVSDNLITYETISIEWLMRAHLYVALQRRLLVLGFIINSGNLLSKSKEPSSRARNSKPSRRNAAEQ